MAKDFFGTRFNGFEVDINGASGTNETWKIIPCSGEELEAKIESTRGYALDDDEFARGVTDYKAHEIYVRRYMTLHETIVTCIHEVLHASLGPSIGENAIESAAYAVNNMVYGVLEGVESELPLNRFGDEDGESCS